MSKYINKHRIFFILFKFKNLVENIIGLKIQLKNKNNFISRTVPEYRYIPIANYLFEKGPLNLLEVGAHKGFLIDQFKNNIKNKNLSIYGIEPNTHCYNEISKKFSSNKNIKLFNHALYDSDCELVLNITKYDNLSSILKPNALYTGAKGSAYDIDDALKVEQKMRIKAVTGDNFIEINQLSSVEILSLNTQGTEMKVLDGFKRSFSQKLIKSVMIEIDLSSRYESKYDLHDVESFMKNYDFYLHDINLIKNIMPTGIKMLDVFYVHKSIYPKR